MRHGEQLRYRRENVENRVIDHIRLDRIIEEVINHNRISDTKW